MKHNPKCIIEECVSKDTTRQPLLNVHLTKQGYAIATDGKRLTAVKVKMEPGDTPGPISPQALKASRKGGKYEAVVACNGNLSLMDGTSFPRPECERYPRWQAVLPKYVRDASKGKFSISLDASLLAGMQKAFGSDSVTLVFGDDCSPIAVKPNGHNPVRYGKSFGVLMPVRLA